MKLPYRLASVALTTILVAGNSASADPLKAADFPLRLHIFSRDQETHHHGSQETFEGDGRANLFVHGDVSAIDFRFRCPQKIEPSIGFETYKARWQLAGKRLIVLMPVFGEPDKFFTCEFDTDVKQGLAYYTHDHQLETEPAARFKDWMTKHSYDPEHGKEAPAQSSK